MLTISNIEPIKRIFSIVRFIISKDRKKGGEAERRSGGRDLEMKGLKDGGTDGNWR